jgi:peptidoglycan/LPS O-acetylase OafA/YrhL
VLELGLPLGVPAWILLLVALALTVLSYRYVEQPLRAPSGA